MDLEQACASKSIELLRRAARPEGFAASPAFEHYHGIWARDAAIAGLGACRLDERDLRGAVAATLRTLAQRSSDKGQIPAAIWPDRVYWDWGDAGCVDASAWFVIALGEYTNATGDEQIAAELWPAALRALEWLSYQDVNNFGLVDSPAASDWMDSSLSRSGKVLHINVLYYWAARHAESMADVLGERPPLDAEGIRDRINLLFWPRPGRSLMGMLDHVAYPGDTQPDRLPHPTAEAAYAEAARANREFYGAAFDYGNWVDQCDVLANLLAIVSGVTDDDRANRILDYLRDEAVAEPYPSKTWPHSIEPEHDRWGLLDVEADRLQDPRWRNPPGQYHNGGIWPFIGGFHVAALARLGRSDEARGTLARLAEANQLGAAGPWGFHEWLHADSGRPGGAPDQTWNAGAYLLADHEVANLTD